MQTNEPRYTTLLLHTYLLIRHPEEELEGKYFDSQTGYKDVSSALRARVAAHASMELRTTCSQRRDEQKGSQ